MIASLAFLAGLLRADQSALGDMGLNTHLLRYADYAAACDELIASGVKSVRIGIEWGTLQPAPGALPASADPAWLARLDDVVNRLRADSLGDRKVEILFILAYGTDWCSTAPAGTSGIRFYPPTPTTGLDAWAAYVSFLATRYNGKIARWEVWNEPDSGIFLRIYTPPGGSPAYTDRVDAYKALLSRAYDAIKTVNPANQVLLAGIVMPPANPQATDPNAPYMQVDFLDQLLARGAGSKFDVMNYHAYGDSVTQRAKYLAVESVLAKYGLQDRKIWFTETGYSTSGNTSLEDMKADRITQHWLNHLSYPNIERVFWYVDRNVTSGDAIEDNFGLRAANRSPLAPWFHYQALDGAFVDFERQNQYPSVVPAQNAVYYGGSGIADYNSSGSEKLIPVAGYMYFYVNDSWIYDANDGLDDTVYVNLEYFDNVSGAGFRLDYDPKGTATNTQLPVIIRQGTNTWKTATFTIPNAGFTNSNNGTADFRIYAGGTAALPIRNVVVRRRSDAARIKLGSADRYFLMDRQNSDVSTDLNYNPALTYNGETCRQIPTGKYMLFRVSDAFIRTGDSRVRLKVRFWDDAGGNLLVEYNAAAGSATKAFGIAKTGTNAWRTATVDLSDADFRNAGSWGTDFRLYSGADGSVEYVSYLEVSPLQPLSDDFQDGDSAGWTTSGGTWAVTDESGNKVLKQTATTGETIAVAGVSTWSDYDFSADLKLYNSSAAGILARYSDSNNYYVFAISTGLDRLYLKKRVAGVTTSLVDLPWDFSVNTTYNLRLVLNGPWISAFVGSAQVASIYDSSLSIGRAGVRGVDAIFSSDNLVVRKTLRDNAPFAAWRRSWFTMGELGDPSFSGDSADPDEDGLPNRLEFALNLNPLDPDSANATPLTLATNNGQTYLNLAHRKRRLASDLSFFYEASADLSTWTTFTPTASTTTTVDAQTDLVTVRTPLTEPRRFLRLRIEHP